MVVMQGNANHDERSSHMSRKIDIPFFDRYMLTVDEASAYFHIGEGRCGN